MAENFKKKISGMCGGSFKWGIKETMLSYQMLFDRFCPFKEGDRVELLCDIDTSNAPGWANCKHFLVRGAKATVDSRGCRNGKFTFDIIFDKETWINSDNEEKDVSTKHTFCFGENKLRRLYEDSELTAIPKEE